MRIIMLFIVLINASINCTSILIAQWQLTNLPKSVNVSEFASKDSLLYAATDNRGIFPSSNKGMNWDTTNIELVNKCVRSLVVKENLIYAGTTEGVYYSTNNGKNWIQLTNNGLSNVDIRSVAIQDSNVFIAAGGFSADNAGVFILPSIHASNWYAIDSGFTCLDIMHLFSAGNNIIAGSVSCGIYFSTNKGASWNLTNGIPNYSSTWCIITSGSNVYLSTGKSIYVSKDNGLNWAPIGMPPIMDYNVVSKIAVGGFGILAGTSGDGVFLSTDNGTTWKNIGLSGLNTFSLIVVDSIAFVSTVNTGVWRTSLSQIISDVHQSELLQPHKIFLEQNYPNPFNPSTAIQISLSATSEILLSIINLSGKEVARVYQGKLKSGKYSFLWDASKCASGIYFCRLIDGNYIETKKIVLLK